MPLSDNIEEIYDSIDVATLSISIFKNSLDKLIENYNKDIIKELKVSLITKSREIYLQAIKTIVKIY